jgi:hypothetical protein
MVSLLAISCLKEQNSIQTQNAEPTKYQYIDADSVFYKVLGIDSLSVVEFYKTDLNNDNYEDLIILQNPPIDDPGVFSRVTVHLGNIGSKHYDTQDVFDKVPDELISSVSSSLSSDLISVYPYQEGSLIFAFGLGYGSGMSESLVIRVNGETMDRVFYDAYNRFISLSGLEDGQTPELVLRKDEEYWGEVDSLNIMLTSYCPYQVLKLGELFEYDSLKTMKYNIEHYVFQGHEPYNSDITVAVPRDGSKPYVYRAN